jgi:hypothetical protein
MPNGGIGPSCFICKFAQPDAHAANPLRDPLFCQHHGMQVWLPLMHVCGCLITKYNTKPPLIEQEQMDEQAVYARIEVQYRTAAYPTLPQYHHEYHFLTAVSTYRTWTETEQQAQYQILAQRVWNAFREQYRSTNEDTDTFTS